jgi:hypothetical protein
MPFTSPLHNRRIVNFYSTFQPYSDGMKTPSLFERMREIDRRHHPRFVTSFWAELITEADRKAVVVGDISAGGAMLEESRKHWPGRPIRLVAKSLDVRAVIKWQKGELCGIAFAERVDPLAVIEANGAKVIPLWEEPPA